MRTETFNWLARNGYSFVPSSSNCFMLDAKRPTKEVIAAMAALNVFIGRAWPAWPTHVRITVGTQLEMEKFRTAFHEVMLGKSARIAVPGNWSWRNLDGQRVPTAAANA